MRIPSHAPSNAQFILHLGRNPRNTSYTHMPLGIFLQLLSSRQPATFLLFSSHAAPAHHRRLEPRHLLTPPHRSLSHSWVRCATPLLAVFLGSGGVIPTTCHAECPPAATARKVTFSSSPSFLLLFFPPHSSCIFAHHVVATLTLSLSLILFHASSRPVGFVSSSLYQPPPLREPPVSDPGADV